MNIIYLPPPPSTPGEFFVLMLKSTGLAYLGTLLIYGIFSLLGSDNNMLFGFLHNIFSPVTSPVFALAGLRELTVGESGVFTLFIIIFTPALLNIIPIMRLKLEQLDLLDQSYGPIRRPEHWRWFAPAFALFAGIFFLGELGHERTPDLGGVILGCTLLVMLAGCFFGSLCFLIIGWRLRASWLKSPEAILLASEKANRPKKAAKKKQSHLRVAVDNSADSKAAPTQSLFGDMADNGIYIALTAELIQAAGRNQALPTPEGLLQTLTMLQKAALMTRSGQYTHPDLHGLCEKTCALFAEGKLKNLPNLKEAQALYKKANPARLMDIAAELKQQLAL